MKGAELQAGQMPDELSIFPVADARCVDVLVYIITDAAWRGQACMECLGPRRGGHDALDVAVTSSSAARRFAFRGISPSSASDCSQARRGCSARSYFQAVLSSKDVFAKGNESFPSGKGAAFFKLKSEI